MRAQEQRQRLEGEGVVFDGGGRPRSAGVLIFVSARTPARASCFIYGNTAIERTGMAADDPAIVPTSVAAPVVRFTV